MNEEKTIKISVTLNTEPLEKALGKANDLVEVINKAKSLSNDLGKCFCDNDPDHTRRCYYLNAARNSGSDRYQRHEKKE